MAIIKHLSSKNSSYSSVLEYYTLKHKEDEKTGHYHLLRDEMGYAQERENYAVYYLTADGQKGDPQEWASACARTNFLYKKNQDFKDRKIHQYIISHPEADRPKMTMDDLLEEGIAFSHRYLEGYDALIAVHRDTDNDHIHISVNSVRTAPRKEQDWMMKDPYGKTLRCETAAGGKHQNSPTLMHDCQEWLMNYSMEHGLTVEDNLARAEQIRRNRYGEQTVEIRNALLAQAKESKNLEQLQKRLVQENDIKLEVLGEIIRVTPPGKNKPISLKSIGITKDELLKHIDHGNYVQSGKEQQRKDVIQKKIEEKKYRQWLRERRDKNAQKAEDTIAISKALISDKLHAAGNRYTYYDFQELDLLIKKTTYVRQDLQTEADKLDAMIGRWEIAKDDTLPSREREKHAKYICWCGSDPNSQLEYEGLKNEREIIQYEMDLLEATRNELCETCEKWKNTNEELNSEREYQYTINRTAKLENQLAVCRANRKQLSRIAFNCQRAALRRSSSKEFQNKADYYYKKYEEAMNRERMIKKQLAEQRKNRQLQR